MTDMTELRAEIREFRKDVKDDFVKLDTRLDDQNTRLNTLETGYRLLRWAVPLLVAIFAGVRCIQVQTPAPGIVAQSLDACPTVMCVPMTVTPGVPVPTPLSTQTATATSPPESTGTLAPTQIAPTATPEGQPTVNPSAVNLLRNQGFEEPYRQVTFSQISVAWAWEPFYCALGYGGLVDADCPAPRQGSGNPTGLLMGRPEYKVTYIGGRVVAGAAQQWFCFYRTCQAGVYQTVTVPDDAWCEVGAQVQSWSTNSGSTLSDLITMDDKANSTWFIRVDPSGGTNAFAPGVLISRGFGFEDGIYDRYATISYRFRTSGPRVTVFFENLRLWPISNNDNYIDRAYVRCN